MFRARLVARLVMEVRVPEGTRARGLALWSHTWGAPRGSVLTGLVGGEGCLGTCPGGECQGLPLGSLKQQPEENCEKKAKINTCSPG